MCAAAVVVVGDDGWLPDEGDLLCFGCVPTSRIPDELTEGEERR